MPALESLDNDADFSPFLSEGVSEALRKKALRKLFHLPQFNVRDGLNDYDDDFTEMAPLGDTLTYQMKRWLAAESESKPVQAGSGSGAEAHAGEVAPSSQDAQGAERAEEDDRRSADRVDEETRQPADRGSGPQPV